MLVLTRKCEEMIQIGDGIVIKIIRTGKNAVKIGIQAPADVRVMRAELCTEAPSATLTSMLDARRQRMAANAAVPATAGQGM